MKPVRVAGPWFKDASGRTLLLRGVNLGGSSKVPSQPPGATHLREGFFDHRQVSFVGRPFPLDEADEHFGRLKAWGMRFLLLLVTWEAVEHGGPGEYDLAYLDYLQALVARAGEHGLQLFIDPHQDVWSRFSGGDGAPGWTFEAVGLDIRHFDATGAAIRHQVHGDPFPRMIWPTNSGKLAAATMFTLFFGGSMFAPRTLIDGEPADEFLQRRYIRAMARVAEALRGFDHVVGYDTLNEPLAGYIGWEDLTRPGGMIRLGPSPSALQGMLLGAGIPQSVPVLDIGLRGERVLREQMLNPDGQSAWLPGFEPIWRAHGVWDLDPGGRPRLLQPHYFTTARGTALDFDRDFYRPFANRFAAELRRVDPQAIIFLESEPHRGSLAWGADDADRIVYAPHWYDGFTLYMKRFSRLLAVDHDDGSLVFGPRRIRRSFREQLARRVRAAARTLAGIPVLLGEFGVPMDLAGGRAFRGGRFAAQAAALDRSFQAIEANLLSCTLWNYTADNDNAHGDQWNGEDLSIFSRDQQHDPADPDSGGRALAAAVRPYPRCTAGEPLELDYDNRRRRLRYSFRHDPQVSAPTEFFIPALHYPRGVQVQLSDGTYDFDASRSTLTYRHDPDLAVHRLVIRPA